MKILALPESYLPNTVGGKEVYCHTMGTSLARRGVTQEVLIHGTEELTESYNLDGIAVTVLPALQSKDARLHAYERTFDAVPGFESFLEKNRPDVVHFHDQSGGASLSHLRIVNKLGIPSVLTFHTPGQFCPQRALLRNGTIPCDGKVTTGRCTRCRLRSVGIPDSAARLLALGSPIRYRPGNTGRIHRLLTSHEMTRRFAQSNQEFFERIDRLIVYADWATDVLRLNGCPEGKIRMVRTGGRQRIVQTRTARPDPQDRTLRLACVGRCESVKGFHVLIDAIKQLPAEFPIEVHFFSPNWGDNAYGLGLDTMIAGDARFRPPKSVNNSALASQLCQFDVMVVPSIWLETGPLTVFDAFAAGLPVVGSRLGGIAELVIDQENGILFEPGDSMELSKILRRLAEEADLLPRLKRNVPAARTMDDVADEMLVVYSQLVAKPDRR